MNNFIFILTSVILPVFIQIFLGVFAGKKLHAKSETLVTVQFYILIPAIIFVKMYDFGVDGIAPIVLHSCLIFAILYFIAAIIAKLKKFDLDKRQAFINTICYFNSGNFSIPVINSLYSNPIGLATQVVVMTTQNVITNTVGIFTCASGKAKDCLIEVLKLPMVYAAILGGLLSVFKVPIFEPVYRTINVLADAMVPIALITLGIQLSVTKFGKVDKDIFLASALRLVFSPILSLLLTYLLGIKGIPAQVLVISAAAPTAVNAVLLSIQYHKAPDFSSKVALLTTALSAFSVTAVIIFATTFM